MEKYKILRVTVTEDYLIDMIDDERTKINGWTLEKVIEDWFTTHATTPYHATRDGHRIGNSKKFIIDLSANNINIIMNREGVSKINGGESWEIAYMH